MSWGVAVPGDETQVMYVWFDALVNYISTLGWPEDTATFEEYWGTKEAPNAVQFAGKDNLRQQSAMWQAMLMSAGLPPTKQIVIHGFITSGGQKMSKSLGNVVNPYDIVAEYGTDALRYYLARHTHPFEDSDFTMEKFKEAYNAHLVNGIGNLTSRIMKMAEDNLSGPAQCESDFGIETESIEHYEVQKAVDAIWQHIGYIDDFIQQKKPFNVVKEDKVAGVALIEGFVKELHVVATELQIIMPTTSKKILDAIKENKKPASLFPRKE